tara:strand:+ start:1524 stop:2921 length:1398 start_codon:yes stop_codon:yes gene_type:complete
MRSLIFIIEIMSTKCSDKNIPYEGAKDTMKPVAKTEDEEDECMICLDVFNKGRRRKIVCPGCQKGCCESCFRSHLLISSSSDPECAGCHHKLSLEFIAENTPKVFHNNEYRKKRSIDLLSKEKSLLPATQLLVIREKKRVEREKQIHELMDESNYLRSRLREIKTEIYNLRMETDEIDEKKERKRFIMGCPIPDCRGFLSQSWKCETCETHICSKCRAPKEGKNDDTHVCNEDDVATAKLLSKETKPCPSCAVPIFKVSGCDQMWCVECKTPFSWKTGLPVTGIIHNPHFYQWQRENNGGVAPRRGDRYDCGGMPWIRTLRLIIRERMYRFPNWTECHRSVGHVRGHVMPAYPPQIGVYDHEDLRLKYLLKNIDEDEWLTQLRRRQKRIEKNQEVHNILDMYVVTLTDLFQRFTRNHFDIYYEALALRNYVNDQLHKISKRYNNVVPKICDDWGVHTSACIYTCP